MDKLKFGGKEYPLKSPTLKKSGEWREKISPVFFAVTQTVDQPLSDQVALAKAIVGHPKEMVQIVASYPGLEITEDDLQQATEEELLQAFTVVMVAAFRPMLEMVGTIRSVLNAFSGKSQEAQRVN